MRRYYRCKDINIISNSDNSRGETLNRSDEKKEIKKVKFDFCKKKDNTIRSLNEVEHFLCDLKSLGKYIKLYYLFK